jgi:hypothetical protein
LARVALSLAEMNRRSMSSPGKNLGHQDLRFWGFRKEFVFGEGFVGHPPTLREVKGFADHGQVPSYPGTIM